MKRLYFHLLVLTCVVICFLAPGIVNAQSRSNIDVALVMDSSGSMKKTDPKSLRIPAAKLFISLLGSNDRAAVLSFSDQGYPIADLTPVNNEANKKKLLNATEKITSDGLHTNLYGAFNKGMEVLLDAKEDGREQIIVLMSDGMMDVGDHEKDMQLINKLKSELSGVLKKNNIKVYAVAFTDQSDRRLLEKLSKQTGGFYNLALTDRDFHLIFTSIFESLKSPEMLPIEKNGFLIDRSIQEVTIVVSKESAETDIQINAPDGQQYSGNQKYSGISWFVSDNFDMITVQRPVEGRWEILYSTSENNKAYIITDLALETNFEQLYAVFGENLDIKAWLEKEGAIIRDGEVLETTDLYIKLNNPDGNISNLKPLNSGDGIFQKSITPFKDGNYKLRVIAKGKTYEREKAFLFNVANLQESKEDLKAAREARQAEQTADQEASEEEEQAPVNWTKIIIQLISLNLIIGILVVAYMKRQSIKDFKLIGKLFKRTKDTKQFQAKKKESEERDSEAESATEKSAEKKVDETAQVRKNQVVLEDEDSEIKEVEQVNEEEDKESVKERVALEDAASEEDGSDDTGNDGELNNLDEEIQRLEKLKQQDEDTPSAEAQKVSGLESEGQQSADAGTDETAQTEAEGGEDIVDDMWADAMNEQAAESEEEKTESDAEEQKTDEQAPQVAIKETLAPAREEKKQVKAEVNEEVSEETGQSKNEEAESLAEEHELDEETQLTKADNSAETQKEEHEVSASIPEEIKLDESGEEEIEDMWADALDEQAKVEESIEKTASTNIDTSQDVTELAEGESEKDADQMWAEALSDNAEAEASEENPLESKDNPGGSQGATG